MITVYVTGTPRPQPRPRFVRGRVVSTASKSVNLYRNFVISACREQAHLNGPVAGAVEIDLKLWFPTKDASRFGKPHTARVDGDNVLKLWQDCAERAGLLPKGDAAVARASVSKIWAPKGGAVMTLKPLVAEAANDDDLGACPVECA